MRVMAEDEILQRISVIGRIFAAWPNARPSNETILQYVNATRGIPLTDMDRFANCAIQWESDFVPPAGQIVFRAAMVAARERRLRREAEKPGGYSAASPEERDAWHARRISDAVFRDGATVDTLGSGPQLRLASSNPVIKTLARRIAGELEP